MVPAFFYHYCFIQTFRYCPYVLENIFGNETWRKLNFIEKNNFFFNSGLCGPFSEKRYICFLLNILAALLIILIPNLVRKCQIICTRIWVEEIVFLTFFGTVSKENRFLLLTIATVVKENLPQFISKYFLSWWYFYKQRLSQRLGTWDIFSRRFSIVCISMTTGNLYTDKFSRLCFSICAKYTVSKKKVLLWNPHMSSTLIPQ